ncbi:MAG TPA: biotin carboxylase N-terminal domain-containing protein, partial [Aggregatilineales bacterium]|nr:biotin carboxylase N-terminal domain-containing protein [Aggregatilineales bacterium]
AYYIGAPPPRDSYLNMGKLIDVARQSNADAIHPGYGFLSEREVFAETCEEAGIIFVGPPPNAIRTMGDKQTARMTVKAAGVPIVPGTEPGLHDEDILRAAEGIGYPVLVKASAGGGGKGM